MSLDDLLFFLLNQTGHFTVLPANALDSFLNQIYQKRFLWCLSWFLRIWVLRLFCCELRYFLFTGSTSWHYVFQLVNLTRLVVWTFFIISAIFYRCSTSLLLLFFVLWFLFLLTFTVYLRNYYFFPAQRLSSDWSLIKFWNHFQLILHNLFLEN